MPLTPQRKAQEAKRKEGPKWAGSKNAKVVIHMAFTRFFPNGCNPFEFERKRIGFLCRVKAEVAMLLPVGSRCSMSGSGS